MTWFPTLKEHLQHPVPSWSGWSSSRMSHAVLNRYILLIFVLVVMSFFMLFLIPSSVFPPSHVSLLLLCYLPAHQGCPCFNLLAVHDEQSVDLCL